MTDKLEHLRILLPSVLAFILPCSATRQEGKPFSWLLLERGDGYNFSFPYLIAFSFCNVFTFLSLCFISSLGFHSVYISFPALRCIDTLTVDVFSMKAFYVVNASNNIFI